MTFGGIFDGDLKLERLQEVEKELEQPDLWNDPDKAQALGKEKVNLEGIVVNIKNLQASLTESLELFDMVRDEQDEVLMSDILSDL